MSNLLFETIITFLPGDQRCLPYVALTVDTFFWEKLFAELPSEGMANMTLDQVIEDFWLVFEFSKLFGGVEWWQDSVGDCESSFAGGLLPVQAHAVCVVALALHKAKDLEVPMGMLHINCVASFASSSAPIILLDLTFEGSSSHPSPFMLFSEITC